MCNCFITVYNITEGFLCQYGNDAFGQNDKPSDEVPSFLVVSIQKAHLVAYVFYTVAIVRFDVSFN